MSEQCRACKKDSKVHLKHMGPYCKSCFCQLIEKRVRKELRTKYKLVAHEHLIVIDDNSKEAKVGEYLIRNISKSIPLQIEVKKEIKDIPKDARIIIPTSATKIAANFLKEVMLKEESLRFKDKEIPLLESLNEQEIITFANFKNLEYQKEENSEFEAMVEKIEKNYQGATFSINKSKEVLKKKADNSSKQ